MTRIDGSLPDVGWALYGYEKTPFTEGFSKAVVDVIGAMPTDWVADRDKTEAFHGNENLLIPSQQYYYLEAVQKNGFSRFSSPNGDFSHKRGFFHPDTLERMRTMKDMLSVLGYSFLEAFNLPVPKQNEVFCSIGIIYEPGAVLCGSTKFGRGHRDVLRSEGTVIMSHLPSNQPDKLWEIDDEPVTQPAGSILVLGRDPAYEDRDIMTPHHYVEAGDERIVSYTFQAIGIYGSKVRLALEGITV